MTVSLARFSFATKEFRSTDPLIDSALADRDKLAQELNFQTLFLSESDALAMRDSLSQMRTSDRKTYLLQISREAGIPQVGDQILIAIPQYNLGEREFLVKGVRVDLSSTYSQVTVYGPK